MKFLITILVLATAGDNVLGGKIPSSARCDVKWGASSWNGVCVANEKVNYKRPFIKNDACSNHLESDWCSVSSMPCAFTQSPETKGVCFNVGSECTGQIYYYETGVDGQLLCPGGLACCVGGTIAGPNPFLNRDTLYSGIEGIDHADSDNGQTPTEFYDTAGAAGGDSFNVGSNSVSSDNSDFSLIASGPGTDSFDQASLPSDSSSSFKTAFDDVFSAPSAMDYTAFSEPSDSSGFLSASADRTDSIFGDLGSWNSGDTDLFSKDFFNA